MFKRLVHMFHVSLLLAIQPLAYVLKQQLIAHKLISVGLDSATQPVINVIEWPSALMSTAKL